MKTEQTGASNAEWKLALAAVAVTCVTGYMAFVGGSSNWQYYLTVEECRAEGTALQGKRIRVNGTIVPTSLKIDEGRKSASFSLEGPGEPLKVTCPGPLPDNLAEGMQVVVEGEIQKSGLLQGEHVLTRCASKYEAKSSAAVARNSSSDEIGRAR